MTRRLMMGLVLLAAGCKTSGGAGDGPDPAPKTAQAKAEADDSAVTLPLERYQLDNGLTVILHEDHRLPLVAVSVWYDVGGLHEKPGRSGFAHLFEHMMFQGSAHTGADQHFKILESVGGTGMNGTTSFDRTNYFETVPSNELETALWLESDRMGFLLPAVTEEALKNQIDVVQNERRQSVVNRPYGLMSERITKTLYPAPHPYHGDVIGSMEDIAAASLEDVKDFFRTYYTPANATLTLSGDFDPVVAKQLVAKYFGPLEGRDKPPVPTIPAPKLEEPVTIDFEEPVGKLAKIHMAWMGPSAYEADTAALDLLAHVISGTRSSRLDKRVSHDEVIAQSVTAYFQEFRSGGHFHIDLTVRPDKSLDEAERAIEEVLADLEENPPTLAELTRAQTAHDSRVIRGLQQLGGFGGRAERLQQYSHYLGDPQKLAWDLERYREVSVADLVRVMKTYLSGPRLVVRASPKGAEKANKKEANR